MNTLHLNDEIFDLSRQEVTMVVTSTHLPQGRIRVMKLDDDSEGVLQLQALHELISAGEIAIRRPHAPLVSPAMQADARLDTATADALRITHEVRDYSRRYSVSTCDAYKQIRQKYDATNFSGQSGAFPSRATIYRYLHSERAGLPLLCGNKNKGNRTRRHDASVESLIQDVASKYFLHPESRWTIRAVTETCNLQAHNNGLLSHTKQISRKFVQRVIFENLSTDTAWDRMDPRTRAAQKAVAKNRIRVDGILQRVEQDAVHLPWRVRTPAGDAKNIWLVHSIDCATSMLVGWHLVIGAPNASSGIQCVESILFSKKDKFAALGLEDLVDCYGSSTRIVFDNGAEAKNDRMNRLTCIGIDLQYCKSRHPHHKPFIERLNRSLKEALETLPGCTRFDGKDGQRNPEELGDLPMTLVELEKWIVRWYFEVWGNTPLKRLVRSDFFDERELGSTPLARFKGLQKGGYAMPLPPNRDTWLLTKYEHHERTLARTTGITYESFNFRGKNLERLIARHGERTVKVLVDPDDYRTLQVVDGSELVPLVNIDVDETTPAFSFVAAKALGKEMTAAAAAIGAETVKKFKSDQYARSSEVPSKKAGSKAGSATDRARAVSQRAKSQAAVERARDKPLPASATNSAAMQDLSLDSVPALSAVNRKTGVAV